MIRDAARQAFSTGRGEAEPSPAEELAALAELVDSGLFAAREEDSRRNKTCRIGAIGAKDFRLAGQAVVLLAGLLDDPDNIVRWDAASGILDIAGRHSFFTGDAFILLEKTRRRDPDPELRLMVEVGLKFLRERRNAQEHLPGLYAG